MQTPDLERIARDALGFDQLRPGQEEAAESVAAGVDTLVVMPTGSGKTAIYQLAAVALDGPSVVVSPLIALQADQVRAIAEDDAGEGALVNSSIGEAARREVFERFERGEIEYLFLAPEQLANPTTVELVKAGRPSLLVVDEAHCVSEWGHDFRPDYLRLGAVREELGHPTVLALTATASPPVREEILSRLCMTDAKVIVRGFDRPNIHLAVETFHERDELEATLLDRVVQADGTGIVYVPTRKDAERYGAELRERGLRAAEYHAGLPVKERRAVQEGFLGGELDVIAATTAFGMGIDKPDVRFVYHSAPSESVDSYYQEIGRAGRDGEPAEAVLFYRQEDLGLRRFFASGGKVDEETLAAVGEAIAEGDGPVDEEQVAEATGLSERKLTRALNVLEDVEAVQRVGDDEVEAVDPERLEDAVAEATHGQELRKRVDASRIEMVRTYAETRDCRRQFLLNYFGELSDKPCGSCDNCEAGTMVADDNTPFALNSRVRHTLWGEGLVLRYEGPVMTVLFDDVGYRNLSVEVVESESLLEAL